MYIKQYLYVVHAVIFKLRPGGYLLYIKAIKCIIIILKTDNYLTLFIFSTLLIKNNYYLGFIIFITEYLIDENYFKKNTILEENDI